MNIVKTNNNIIIRDVQCFDVELSVFCGQAFRWRKIDDTHFHGVVCDKVCDIEVSDGNIIFCNCTEEDFSFWRDYFDLDKDYEKILNGYTDDESLSEAINEFYGIRILRQDPWEALCSFIISQNNNIPRIEGIISRLCENFGEKSPTGDFYFPRWEDLKNVTVEDLAPLRAGFRAKYIVDAVSKLASGEISLENIKALPIEEARTELMKIKGVGAKVAECTLLYGFGRHDAFPVDVWVKRIMAEMYPEGLPECTKGSEGIAQQYLFHWRRNSEKFKEKKQ